MLRIVQLNSSLLATLLVCVSALCVHAQAPIMEEPGYTPTLTFDIATIRLSPPPDANFRVSVSSPPHSSRFEATNLPMKSLLQIAYGFEAPITGAPDWIANTFYNIQARSDEAADARLAKLTDNEVRLEKRNALRVLLADRVELRSHMESRNSAIFHLVVGKSGVKMNAVPLPPADTAPATPAPADTQTHGSQHGLQLDGSHASMAAITAVLSAMVETPVLDRTDLTGTYNYTLQFGREWSAHDPESWPSIFTAVQEQLGLKLEAVHESVPNLVIDHMTKPTEN